MLPPPESADFKAEQDRIGGEIKAAERTIAKWSVELDAIEQRLDEALSILLDPYKLFAEAPDGIRLMLVQAVFDKLWVMGAEVVGSELTDTYRDLLAHEARLTLEAREQAAEQSADALGLDDQAPVFYRHRVSLDDDDSDDADLSALVGRLWVERPRGVLPVDGLNSQNPVPPAVEPGSDVLHLVGTTGFEPATP